MVALTKRERLLKMFANEPIDRVPVSPRIFEPLIFEFFGRADVDPVEGAIAVYRHFDMDIIDWNCTPNPHIEISDFTIEGPNWTPIHTTSTQNNTTHYHTRIKTPKGELERVHSITQLNEFAQERATTVYPIKNQRDFDLVQEFMPPVPEIDVESIRRARRLIGDDGVTSPSFHGPFNLLAIYYRKLDDLLMDAMVTPAFYAAMMEFSLDRVQRYALQYINAGGDMLDIGTNVANAKLVSPKFWQDEIVPYENRLVDALQRVPCLFHNCGYARAHLPYYHLLHHRMWGYMAPPPYGDTDFKEAIEILPHNMILWGGLDQIDFLRQATPQQVTERVEWLLSIAKPRGNYILGTTDYLETNTPYENLFAFVEAGHKYGKYEPALV